MYISLKASRIRQREAQNARKNRAEIVKALSTGQVNRRDLIKWGALTASGALAFKHGLHPLVRSAYAQAPTGLVRSPLFGIGKFTQPMPRLDVLQPVTLNQVSADEASWGGLGIPNAKRFSYHEDFSQFDGPVSENPFRNMVSNRGPMEGRPPGEFFKHQRWDEFFPQKGYVMSWASAQPGTKFHPDLPEQAANKVWCYGAGAFAQGTLPPPLIKLRYGEPSIMRVYNNTPVNREDNGGFGRNETQLHFHNAHNGAESDGATAAHHFPGTFYDYLWSTALARRDTINTDATDYRAAGPTGNKVPGDFRELQGTMWIHDHRFFFTAENVYKGALGMVNMYSAPDRGHERAGNPANLRLPSGYRLEWGNVDFDVNLIISDGATDLDGQYAFDLSTNSGVPNDGFLADMPLVNYAYAPYFEVLPRKYRFRILNASMSRFIKLALSHEGSPVPFTFIANDGNFVVNPIPSSLIDHQLDEQGTAERYDIVVDFSAFPVGAKIHLVNLLLMRPDGRGPLNAPPLTLAQALAGDPTDPVIGPIMEFRVASSVASVDEPGATLNLANSCGHNDKSLVQAQLTQQIPIVDPVRTRTLTFGRGATDSIDPATGTCVPECGEEFTENDFSWTIRVDGQDTHSFNANRISLLIPKPGEVEHWTLVGGGSWDHPVHMHFEEGVTMHRGDENIPVTEQLVRKDVWRLGHQPQVGRTVTFQVRFGEFAGSYVTHCHNTVHEDFAMLLRMQLLAAAGGDWSVITPTPIATADGVFFRTPEILPEGDPRDSTSS